MTSRSETNPKAGTVRYRYSFEDCQNCGGSEDTGTNVIELYSKEGEVATLCWECLKGIVEDLYENPPE